MRSSGPYIAVLLLAVFLTTSARAVETDQYMTWGKELNDSAEPLNAWFNTQVERYIGMKNRLPEDCSCEELTQDLMHYFFSGRRLSPIKVFIRDSEEIELYPDESTSNFEYLMTSIYQDPAFPFIVPMARTLRVGDVYFGLDKFGHMFGFGNRYYKRFLKHRDRGMTEEQAIRKIVRWGILLENTIVGKLGDGVFSHGDMEANYQGMMLARGMCEGPDSYIQRVNGRWVLARQIDLRDYITPQFDESYNPSHYGGPRKRNVLRILDDQYCAMLAQPHVQERFARYDEHEPSLSYRIIEEHFEAKEPNPQRSQALITRCAIDAVFVATLWGTP